MRRRTTWPTIAATLAALLSEGGAALAQPEPDKPAEPPIPEVDTPAQLVPRTQPDQRKLSILLRPRVGYAFESSFDDSAADASVARAGVGLDLAYPVNERLKLLLNSDLEASVYSIDGRPGTLLDDPFDDVYRLRVSPGVFFALNQQWGLLGGGLIELAGEADADAGDSATYGGYFGVRYAFTEHFAMTVGVQAKTRLEEDPYVLPIIGFEWRLNERVSLSTSGPGLGLSLTAAINEHWLFTVGAAWESRDYRLRDDGPIPDGVARDERVPIGAGFTWRPKPTVDVSVFGGAIVWQKYRFDDSEGNELLEDNTDPTAFIGFAATFRF